MTNKILITFSIFIIGIFVFFVYYFTHPGIKIAALFFKQARSNTQAKEDKEIVKYPDQNLLGKEKSPYLLQHANNPVWWYPWGEKAFAKAKAQDKPIFLSIGYSTCHWCHVMEHESFENPSIAELLNKYFVCIKVDREERPDIDNIYMKAVMSMTGRGGWPLTVFLTPDRKPFYGGTYFPAQSQWGMPGLKSVLLSIHEAWQNQRSQLLQSSQSITENLQSKSFEQAADYPTPTIETLKEAYLQFVKRFDARYGGFGSAPKFPSSHNLSFLLRYWRRSHEPKTLEMMEKTLTQMAAGGIYDHIGGGFHRYSTDQRWFIPHFEKMLYDQAILSKTYLEAYQVTKKEDYAQTARGVLDYLLRDMTDTQGAFYSAEDADSLPSTASAYKSEGAFYCWRAQDIVEWLGKDSAAIFHYYYGVEPDGNVLADPHGEFTGKNILYVAHSLDETAKQFGQTPGQIKQILSASRDKLFAARRLRPRPHVDDKVLVDSNGLMISSLAFGCGVLHEPKYCMAAEKSAQFILTTLVRKDGRLLHRYRDGEAGILGTLDDYAFFIHGLIDLYEATFKVEYLKRAKHLMEDMVRLFWDEEQGGFFFTGSDAEKLLVREKIIYDGAMPSGNSIASLDLLRLSRLTMNEDLAKKAHRLLTVFGPELSSAPYAFAQALMALDFALGPSQEVVIAGQKENEQTQAMLKNIQERFLPNTVVIVRPASDTQAQGIIDLIPFVKGHQAIDGKTTAYVCKNYTCEFPTSDLKKFEQLLGR